MAINSLDMLNPMPTGFNEQLTQDQQARQEALDGMARIGYWLAGASPFKPGSWTWIEKPGYEPEPEGDET